MEKAKVVVLNGVGSVGKTSTAKAFQLVAKSPFLHVQMDSFLEMLPPSMFGHPDGYSFEPIDENGCRAVAIHTGPVLARLMNGMRHAILALAEQGNSVIVDDVMFGGGEADEYRRLLKRFDFRLVGLFAPIEVLEHRERARGDRDIGLARWQYSRVHNGIEYDLEIDLTTRSPIEAARMICKSFDF